MQLSVMQKNDRQFLEYIGKIVETERKRKNDKKHIVIE